MKTLSALNLPALCPVVGFHAPRIAQAGACLPPRRQDPRHQLAGLALPRRQRGALLVSAAVKKSAGKQVACSKTLVAIPGKEEAVETLCQEVVAFTRQRQADGGAGIIAFDCSKASKAQPRPLILVYSNI